ncbi:uncharacterized protein LY89DRAFT_302772 [Mollisia scopiformis]|uniref:Apple domain-containing protein n=1 Tax=Mollisia scopiformis TaxID=149040 RepID=A0A194XR54_MOLSC|nr:uncharacterized protein LY89DRAFT_302772 [Mollisia scopiformis]KUJ22534.1 hypothetical protein LY89DRAFT_302772 [Mollisia scopiformis]
MKFTALFLAVGFASAIPQPLPASWSNTGEKGSEIQELFKHVSPLQGNDLEARSLPTCHHDNLFRIFLDHRYSSSASAFCSTYITSTMVSTIVPLTTTTITAMETAATAFSTVIVLATATSTTLAPDAIITVAPKAKRQALAGCPGKAGTYPPARISSACSCLVTPALMISTTTTAALSTVTIASTIQITAAATITETSTTVLDVAGPAAATSTIIGSPAPASYCSAGTMFDPNNDAFTVHCATSYASGGATLYSTITAISYQDCLNSCGANVKCRAFSYLLTVSSNNCYLYGKGLLTPSVDPTMDSGVA